MKNKSEIVKEELNKTLSEAERKIASIYTGDESYVNVAYYLWSVVPRLLFLVEASPTRLYIKVEDENEISYITMIRNENINEGEPGWILLLDVLSENGDYRSCVKEDDGEFYIDLEQLTELVVEKLIRSYKFSESLKETMDERALNMVKDMNEDLAKSMEDISKHIAEAEESLEKDDK